MVHVDALLVTALAEESAVVRQVLIRHGTNLGSVEAAGVKVHLFRITRPEDTLLLGHVSAHEMGAIAMANFMARVLPAIQTGTALLTGIAATTGSFDMGDVPVAEQVFSYDDLRMEDGKMTPRPRGYQVDADLRRAAGDLLADLDALYRWQLACTETVPTVASTISRTRRAGEQIAVPSDLDRPQLGLETGAGGPFLLADEAFREALTRGSATVGAVHSKLDWVEMESHGFMHACHDRRIPALVAKGISDNGDALKRALEESTNGFFRAYACSNATLACLHMLRSSTRTSRRINEVHVAIPHHDVRVVERHGLFLHTPGKTALGFEGALRAWGPTFGLRVLVTGQTEDGTRVLPEAQSLPDAPAPDPDSGVLQPRDAGWTSDLAVRFPSPVSSVRVAVAGPNVEVEQTWRSP